LEKDVRHRLKPPGECDQKGGVYRSGGSDFAWGRDKMTEIINLNKARKGKLKQQKKVQAEKNRVIHGLSSKLRKAEQDKQTRQLATLDGKRLNKAEDNEKG
jgi:hypothetical protein